jgi:hypothetical protein
VNHTQAEAFTKFNREVITLAISAGCFKLCFQYKKQGQQGHFICFEFYFFEQLNISNSMEKCRATMPFKAEVGDVAEPVPMVAFQVHRHGPAKHTAR